jgi:hypothetical protein
VLRLAPRLLRLGNSQSSAARCLASIHASRERRVCSVISNCTGRPVLRWRIITRDLTPDTETTSPTRRATRLRPRNLLSNARSNSARSRDFSATCSRMRIPHTCSGLSAGLLRSAGGWGEQRVGTMAGRRAWGPPAVAEGYGLSTLNVRNGWKADIGIAKSDLATDVCARVLYSPQDTLRRPAHRAHSGHVRPPR